MQKRIAALFFAAALGSVPAMAGTLLSLDPVDGQLQGSPGALIGWGSVVNPDPLNWISFTGSALQNLGPDIVGDYVDLIGASGGPVNAVLPPGVTPWVQAFDAVFGAGAGSFTIFSSAAIGTSETGEIVFFYDEFSDDPNTCRSCYLDSNSFIAPFRVDVTAASAPEPGTAVLLILTMVGWLVYLLLKTRYLQHGRNQFTHLRFFTRKRLERAFCVLGRVF
jgi:hypothetical protein